MSNRFLRAYVLAYIVLSTVVALELVASTWLPRLTTPSCLSDTTRSLYDVFASCTGPSLVITAIKLVTTAALVLPVLYLVKETMELSWGELFKQMLAKDGNDSPAIVTVLVAIGLGFIVNSVPATSLQNYVVNLLYRGALGSLVGLVFGSLCVVCFCRIWRPRDVVEQMQATNVEAVALWFGGGFAVAALLF